MSWIESHTTMRNHKKLIELCNTLQITRAQAIGHLHMLWWWAIEHREDGDLTGLFDKDIATACDWDKEPKVLIDALHGTEWLSDYHIKDWDDYSFRLLDMRRANRERQRKYRSVMRDITRDVAGYVPPATVPNLTNIKDMFKRLYEKYPKKQGKADALKAFVKLNPTNALFENLLAALEAHSKTEEWCKENGKYVPLPATWIRGERWTDEIKGNGTAKENFGKHKLVL